MAQNYETNAKKALSSVWDVPKDARIRLLVHTLNVEFDRKMVAEGHEFKFEDHGTPENDYIQRVGYFIATNKVPEIDGDASLEIFNQIREQVQVYGSGLPGMVHPEVIRRLYEMQTQKWEQMAEEHVRTVANGVSVGTRKLLEVVCPSEGATALLHNELQQIITTFHDRALAKALATLNTYSQADRTKTPQTTNPDFEHRLRLLQSLRVTKTYVRVRDIYQSKLEEVYNRMNQLVSNGEFLQTRAALTVAEDLSGFILDEFHSSALKNTVHDVHDILKVYYKVRDNFLSGITTLCLT